MYLRRPARPRRGRRTPPPGRPSEATADRTGLLRRSRMNGPVASLNTAWFALIGVLWTGYLVLEGFDFGVGMLSLAIGRDDLDRRLARNAIGPVWDGNEVWLIVAAGGATFAAFPVWYASMFSGFYLALFIVLAALIVRGVSFEFRGKRDSARWRARLGRGPGHRQPGARIRLGRGLHRPGARPAPVAVRSLPGRPVRPAGPGGGRRRAGQPGHVHCPRRRVPLAQDRRAAGRPGRPGRRLALAAGWRAGGGHRGVAVGLRLPRPRRPGWHGTGRAGRRVRAGLRGVRDPGPGSAGTAPRSG